MLGRIVVFYTILSIELLYFLYTMYKYVIFNEKIIQSRISSSIMVLVLTGYIFRTSNREYFKTATFLRLCTVVTMLFGLIEFVISIVK